MSGSLRGTRLALISCLILSGPPALAQASPAWVDPPSGSDDPAAPGPAAPLRSAQPPLQTASVSREQAARDLAYAYLALWSAPNRVTLASASSFYGPTVTFHGTTRTHRLRPCREAPVCGALAGSELSPPTGDDSSRVRSGRRPLHSAVKLRLRCGQPPPTPTRPGDRRTRTRRELRQRHADDRIREQSGDTSRPREHDLAPQSGRGVRRSRGP